MAGLKASIYSSKLTLFSHFVPLRSCDKNVQMLISFASWPALVSSPRAISVRFLFHSSLHFLFFFYVSFSVTKSDVNNL